MKTQVITISSREPHEPYYHLREFRESARRQGITPHFLTEGPYCGLSSKPKHLKAYLDRDGQKFTHVVVIDSWDTIFLTSLSEIEYNFTNMGVPIVFNCETNCFPRADLAEKFPESPTSYRFLNSGFFFGETSVVIQMLEEMHLADIPNDRQRPDGSWENANDQEWYSRWYLNDFPWSCANIVRKLDYTGILCQSLHDAGENEFAFLPDTQRVVSLLTKNQPCVVHGNGSGKEWLKRIIGWLKL